MIIIDSKLELDASTPKTIKEASTSRAQVITSAVEGASDYQMKWKLKSPAMNSMEFVPATSLHSCQHGSSLIARLFGIIIIPVPVLCNAFMSHHTQILYHKSWNICISYISQFQPSHIECVYPNDISRMIPRMGASVPPLVLMCLIPTNVELASWHPPFDVHRPPFVQHSTDPPFVHRLYTDPPGHAERQAIVQLCLTWSV